MNKLKSKIFWEKYRPTSLVNGEGIPIILLPRIRKIVESGEIDINMFFYGSGGLGKTSLAKILSSNFDVKMITSKERGVETIDIIDEHCKNFSLPLKKKNSIGNPRGEKLIWLEEFDLATPTFRAALRQYMEDYPNIRFIATANNLNRINRTKEDKALIGRFNLINFDPETQEEVEYLKTHQLKYIKAIGKNNNLTIGDDIYEKVLAKSFPNCRIAVQTIQEIVISGSYEQYDRISTEINKGLFEFILNGNNNINQNFFFVQENYPREKTEDLLNLLSTEFFKYLINNREDIIIKNGLKIAKLSKQYNYQYTLTIDPEMHLFNYITELKELL